MVDTPVTLAAVSGAHGVTGDVRLKLLGDGLASLKQHTSFNDGALTLTKLKDDGKGGAIARFDQVSDRNGAEALRGTTLTVARTALPPLPDGEFYHADLIGLPAISDSGETLGVIETVQNFGAGDVVEIRRPMVDGKQGKTFMVPMVPAAVPEWNAERLVVNSDFAEV